MTVLPHSVTRRTIRHERQSLAAQNAEGLEHSSYRPGAALDPELLVDVLQVLHHRTLRRPVTSITRLRLDAALYEPAPARRADQMGRPRLKGERLSNLSVVAEDPNTVWKLTKVANWYGETERMVEVASATAVWPSTGLFAVPLRHKRHPTPSLMRSPWCARSCEHMRLFAGRPRTPRL